MEWNIILIGLKRFYSIVAIHFERWNHCHQIVGNLDDLDIYRHVCHWR